MTDYIDTKIDTSVPFEKQFASKNNICIEGMNINCSSRLLINYISNYNATVINRLKENGYYPSMTTVLDEFAMGGIGRNGITKQILSNPFNNDNITGGSSSGSAKAVALDAVPFALGSSTGGSVKTPSALCNIIGFEPSYGKVSRYGLVAFGSSLDKIGILSKDIKIVKKIFNIISGPDINDMTTVKIILPKKELSHIYCLEPSFLSEFISKDILDSYIKLLEILKSQESIKILFIEQQEEMIKIFKEYSQYYFIISSVEAFSNLERFNGFRFTPNFREIDTFKNICFAQKNNFGYEIKKRLELAKDILINNPEIYNLAFKKRVELIKYMDNFFKKTDILLLPTIRKNYYRIDEVESEDLDIGNQLDFFNSFVNLFKGCSINIPLKNANFQFISKAFNDENLLNWSEEIYNLVTKND